MIEKIFNLNNDVVNKTNFILFYGNNEGLKNQEISKITKNHNILKLDENEILNNKDSFFENILSGSFFEKEKFFIIKRATDRITKIIDELSLKNIDDSVVIIDSGILEKKSKLRSLFEKDKKFICVAFYPDTEQTLSKLAYNFLKEKKISISPANTNLIINKCNGDREHLLNELKKLEYFSKNGKRISSENIAKLTNLAENHSISELIDNCLAKNKKKIISILNENNFSNEDCVLIIRTLLNKSKKLLKLSSEYKNSQNINLTISSAKPPIFWKDKEITKQQILKWTPENIKKLIYKLSEVELIIKKNINISINLITNFILEQSSSNTNN